MEQNNLSHTNLFWFHKRHETQYAIITLIDKISESIDCGDIAINVFLDLKKYLLQFLILCSSKSLMLMVLGEIFYS